MTLIRCDICHGEITITKTTMVYSVAIEACNDGSANDFIAETKQEKALLLSLEHVCADCTAKAQRALRALIGRS
jgi:hypothetical protein